MAFWRKHQSGRQYRAIFPNGGTGAKRAVADLAAYASNKATAQNFRLEGKINVALTYEKICEKIYNHLPAWAKW
jgi:hypothetical protein